MIDDPTLGRICNLLCTVIEELRLLRSETGRKAAAKQPKPLSASDIRMLTALLPEISGAMGDENFSVKSLDEYADGHARQEVELLKAIKATGTRRQLSELLSRAAKSETAVAGLFVHRYPRKRDGVLFSVDTNTASKPTASCVAAALGGTLQK